MSIRAIVFDIGGVLEYTPRLGIDKQWEAKLGLQPGELDSCLHEVWSEGSVGTISLEEVHAKIGATLRISQKQVHALMDDIWLEYLGTLNTELTEFFRGLRPKYQTAIISNSFVGAREREEEHYCFSEICDFIVYSHEVGFRKPDPRIFALACERLGLQPSEIIFVDDHEEVMVSAREMGIHCIEFKDNAQVIAEIEACIQSNS